jgi:hypothetical protein
VPFFPLSSTANVYPDFVACSQLLCINSVQALKQGSEFRPYVLTSYIGPKNTERWVLAV